ncbi:DnaJ-domain-containing protein [Plenodomus tracheiphilus IPT5]|uniref:DnaJ-domain-containing protein n=1 Tax=Plenodomus tracheiphilus IPT5 TaxID=1408161 RepID=A0A6A7B0J8_9PLEO|nr:DnaJ-domain-containing protein [Plenodomus tracheiphilus IPT5]
MSHSSNHYETLGVDTSVDTAAIKKAFRRIAVLNHPDKTTHLSAREIKARTNVFKVANTAHAVLADPRKRREYDLTLSYAARVPNAAPRQSQAAPQPKHTPDSGFNFNNYTYTPPQASSQFPPQYLDPWFYMPVDEDNDRTTINFSNYEGWDFSIGVSKKYN